MHPNYTEEIVLINMFFFLASMKMMIASDG